MQAPDGYTLQKCLLSSPLRALYLARRDADGAEVALKIHLAQGSRERASREFEILRSLPPGIAPQALALETGPEHAVLVLERLAGETLRGPLTASRFLRLAIGAAHAVSRIHATRVVHRNLRPENLLASAEAACVHLVGFGRAAPLGAPSEGGGTEDSLDGPLAYMAPEQTGRLERGVDFRSDLYALGATFYDLLTGRPPFDSRDPLDLIHAHIARRARPPVEIDVDVPATLSRITMKLLEKEPEDRYQTAEALRVDLESCREQLERTGRIDDELPLGAADAPYRPLFRPRIYGRAAECDALWRAYGRAASGELTLLLVRGAPGIGKSALVPELHRPLALDGGYLVRGKFDLYRGHLPYAGFTRAIGLLLAQIASESPERRERWREALQSGLGRLAGAIAEVVPELASLLGPLAPAPKLEPRETQERLALAIRRLLLAAAAHARPLVLFLDDLQWADAGSRYLLEDLLRCGERAPLLAIGTYRDTEVGPGHPLRQLLERLESEQIETRTLTLGPLTAEATCEMLGDALNHPPERVRDLAAEVMRHSGSNPLLIQQCVYHLHQLGCIRFAPAQGWTWDLGAAEAAVIPDDPAGMMLAKLQLLHAETRAVAEFASCVGDEFDAELLAELGRRKRNTLEAALYELSDEGLIAPSPAGFRFVHDRIREAAQALLPETQRAELHLRTATLLMERLSDAEQQRRCLEIADHLQRAARAIPENLRLRAIERQRAAGHAALQAGASATAAHYLAAGIELFREADWSSHANLGFDLHLRLADCLYQAREFERALAVLAPLEARPLLMLQRTFVAALELRIYTLSRSVEETLERTLLHLRQIGEPLPRRPSWLRTRWEVARTDWLLRGSAEAWSFRALGPAGLEPLGPLLIRSAGGQALTLTSLRLMCVNCAAIVRSLLRHGHVTSPAFAVVPYACYRMAFLRSAKGLARYIDGALGWNERAPDSRFGPCAEFTAYAFGRTWTGRRREVLGPLARVAETLREIGEIEYSTNALLMRGHYLGLTGAPLAEVVAAFEGTASRGQVTPIEEPRSVAIPYRMIIETAGELSEFEQARTQLEQHAAFANFAATHWMLALCVFARFADAWWASELARPIIFERLSAASHVADYMLFRGLAACALAVGVRGPKRRQLTRAAAQSHRYLRRWSRHGPDFVHMAQLVEAERMRARGRPARALALYERVAAAAQAAGYVHHAALAHERHAGLLEALGRSAEARTRLSRAVDLYRAWGAEGKLRTLRA